MAKTRPASSMLKKRVHPVILLLITALFLLFAFVAANRFSHQAGSIYDQINQIAENTPTWSKPKKTAVMTNPNVGPDASMTDSDSNQLTQPYISPSRQTTAQPVPSAPAQNNPPAPSQSAGSPPTQPPTNSSSSLLPCLAGICVL